MSYQKPRPKPVPRTFMYHINNPKGQAFPTSQVELLVKDGWTDSPAKLDIEPAKPEVTKEQAVNADPEEIASLAKTMGYIVFTEPELAQHVALNTPEPAPEKTLSDFSDDELLAEAELRGLKEPEVESVEPVETDNSKDELLESDTLEQLQAIFDEDPEALTKPQLVILGNKKFNLGLREAFKEATLIEKITEAMNAE